MSRSTHAIDPVVFDRPDGDSRLVISPHIRGGVYLRVQSREARSWLIVHEAELEALYELVGAAIDLNAARASRAARRKKR